MTLLSSKNVYVFIFFEDQNFALDYGFVPKTF